MIKKRIREENHQELMRSEEIKIKNEKIQKRITKIVGIALFLIVTSISIIYNPNESDFRLLVIGALLVFGMVWSEQYQKLIFLVIVTPLFILLLYLGLSVRF